MKQGWKLEVKTSWAVFLKTTHMGAVKIKFAILE